MERLIVRVFWWLVQPEDVARACTAVREWWGKMRAEFWAGYYSRENHDEGS